jgi:fido (protein-threonine AMPylation protein)
MHSRISTLNSSHRSLIIACGFFLLSLSASACPQFIKALQTKHLPSELADICEAVDRYQVALRSLESQGIKPAERIADLHAPRMINTPTWVKERQAKNFDPWFVYDPAPDTWASWEVGARVIDNEANQVSRNGQFTAFSKTWLKDVHRTALQGVLDTAGEFRSMHEVGKALAQKDAITLDQAAAINKIEYLSHLNPGERMLSWNATECFEQLLPPSKTKFLAQRHFDNGLWTALDSQTFFISDDGSKRQCGYIKYPSPKEIGSQIDKWLQDINAELLSWNTSNPQGDALHLAAKAQRWFVAIHPYERGNGRVSRFAMERILKSIGLPSPILRNMDEDLYSTESQWADEIGYGILRAIKIAEKCAKNPKRNGCNVVPASAPSESASTPDSAAASSTDHVAQ